MNLKENKNTLLANMGNNVKGNKHNPSKRYSATERSTGEINNSIDSNNFNFSNDNRKNTSFYSNNDFIDNDKEQNNEEMSRSFKTERFSVKNNLEEIRNRNFKTIEYSNSRKKRLESIKELEKKLDGINTQHISNQINSNEDSININNNFVFSKNLNNKNIMSNVDDYNKNFNNNNEFNSENNFGLRNTTTFLKNPVNNELIGNSFDRRMTVGLNRENSNIDNINKNNNFRILENSSKNRQVSLKNNFTDEFIDFNTLPNNNRQLNTNELNTENNRYINENNANLSLNNKINDTNYRSIGIREISKNDNNKNLNNNQNNLSDLQLLIQQSVNNVIDMNRRFTQLNSLNQPNIAADLANNRRTSQNSDYHSNPNQNLGHHRVHSHSVNPRNKILNTNTNLNLNQNNHNLNNVKNLRLRSIEKFDDSNINSLNNRNLNINYCNNDFNNNNNNNSILSNSDYKFKINSNRQINVNNDNIFNKNSFIENINRNDYNTSIPNNYTSNKNSNNLNNLTDSFNFNNFKNEEININNNYASANNSLLTDYFYNNKNNLTNNNYSENIKTSNQNLGRKNVFEEESNKRENATTLSLTQKINKIKAERELRQDCKTPEPRKSFIAYNNNIIDISNYNNIIQNSNSSLNNNINNFSSDKNNFNKNNNENENDQNSKRNKNAFGNDVKLNNTLNLNLINNNPNNNQVNNLNSISKDNAENIKYVNDSNNFEIIFEKEEEGISKNPSAIYDIGKQASHEEIRKSVSNFPENKNYNAINDNTNNLFNESINNNNNKNIETRNNNLTSVGNTQEKNKSLNINAININNKIIEDTNNNKNNNLRSRLSGNTALNNQNSNLKNEANQTIKNTNITQASNTNSLIVNKHYSTEVTDSNLNYVLTLNHNINNSKEYSPKSIASNSNYFTEKTQNNLNTSENDLALQSHRITESIKNIMNSNNILNYPDLGNYYNTISFMNADEDANFANKNKNVILPLNSTKNSDKKLNMNVLGSYNKKISFKNTEDIPIVTGEVLSVIKSQSNNPNLNSNGKNNSLLLNSNKAAAANKNILIDKKNQYSQKTISNKNDFNNNITNKKFSLKEKTLTKNTKLTNSVSSIKSNRKENKLGNPTNNTKGTTVKPKISGNNGYQNTEPAKPTKKEDLNKNLPITSRTKNLSKLGVASFNNTTLLSESNENVKKNLTNKFNADSLKKNISRRNLSVSTNPIKKTNFSSYLKSKSLNTSLASSFLGNRKGKTNEANNCNCKCKCVKCKNTIIDFITEEPEFEGQSSIGTNNPSSNSVTNPFSNLKIFENLQAKNFLEFLFIVSDLSLTNLNSNTSTKNIIQNFKNNSILSSKQIYNDLLRILKSLMDNSLNFNIDEETYNRNNVSNFSANSSFFNLSFEKRRSELNRRRDERKNAKIVFIQKKWREYKLRKILKNNNIDFFVNSKADISSKCKNYILESFMKNSKMLMILEYFNKSMVLWNELFNCPKNSSIKNSLIQVKQIEMDNIANFDSNSLLHSIASKAITTHIIEKEIAKENEAKQAAKPKISGNSVKENLFSKIDKKNVSFTSRIANNKASRITTNLAGKK